ncbi:helix-turn-helix transcriptional regulator [Nitratireductor sp. XY-223]|uniref:helix-turn-helix transcriptional regulator n=1 Tax=Nitratireductor sp. XY-223 TaxID=2561926 RepID=UPI0010A997A9|nr:helix-turn-helix transcriptional regulator [Nitratireductor sp. XY-223]
MYHTVFNKLVGKIYDCAVDPDQWVDTLTAIRDEMDLAFVSMNYMAFPTASTDAVPDMEIFNTEWDQDWLDSLPSLVPQIPKWEEMRNAEMDEPVSQLSLMDEATFRQSEFCKTWVEPQGLRDTFNLKVIDRKLQIGMVSATTYAERDLFSKRDYELLKHLSPHLRRSMLISDVVEEQRSWIKLFSDVLDNLDAAVFLVGNNSRIFYHNELAEELLSAASCITSRSGQLRPVSENLAEEFAATIRRACSPQDEEIGYRGNGMTLPGKEGDFANIYVLPLGRSERRRALGPGNAAVFATTDRSDNPLEIEILSAFSGLTTSEARIALLIANGRSTREAAQSRNITISTLRTHLANIYAKTGVSNQAGLAAYVHRFKLPIR